MAVDGTSLIKEKVAYPEKKENDRLGETFLGKNCRKVACKTLQN